MPTDFPSRIVIVGRIAEYRRPQSWNEPTMPGDYHLPFGRAEARIKAARWLWQTYII